MTLFENSWRDGFQFFERIYNEDLKKSVKREIKNIYEWYDKSSNGLYTHILDDSIRLEKKLSSSSKDGRDKYGFLDPIYKNIKDNYWNKDSYNLKPRIWYLDIETRSSRSYINVGSDTQFKIRHKDTLQETDSTVKAVQEQFFDYDEELYEYFDKIDKTWKDLKTSIYFERVTGFPIPEKATEEISLMQFYDNKSNVMFVLGLKDWVHKDKYKFDFEVKFIKCNDEIHLIETYLNIFQKLDPLIIYAWNGNGFDYPYIHNRLKKLKFDVNRLSNYGSVQYSENEFMGRKEFKFNANGHYYVDLMEVYKKFTYGTVTSYGLENIANLELGETKIPHTEYAAFDDFYTGKYIIPTNPNETQLNSDIYKAAINGNTDLVRELAYSEFVYYGCTDTYLIKRIDEKLNFTALMNMISSKMGVQISDSLGTVKPWSQYICNLASLNNQILPERKEFDSPNVVGGYVREPNIGKHKWVLSADVNSMYPLLGMVGFNMSPETYIDKHKLSPELKEIVLRLFNNQNESERFHITESEWDYIKTILNRDNVTLAINGAVFKKDKLGILPGTVQQIYNDRKVAKKTMFKYEQQKILIKEILSRKKAEKEANESK